MSAEYGSSDRLRGVRLSIEGLNLPGSGPFGVSQILNPTLVPLDPIPVNLVPEMVITRPPEG